MDVTTFGRWPAGRPGLYAALVELRRPHLSLDDTLAGLAIGAVAVVISAETGLPWGVYLVLRSTTASPAATAAATSVILLLLTIVAVWMAARWRRRAGQAVAALRGYRVAYEEHERLLAALTHDVASPLATLAEAPMRHRATAAAGRAAAIVGTVTDARALRRGEFVLEPGVYEFGALLSDAVSWCAGLSELHTVELILRADAGLGFGDARRLRRVIETLVDRAIKHSPSGGTIRIDGRTEGPWADVVVVNEGVIRPDGRAALLPAVHQQVTDTATGGLDLDVFLARQIVGRHDGDVRIEIPDARGVLVSLRWRLRPEEPRPR